MMMPRSTEEILAQADELAKRFEDYTPEPGDRDKVNTETRLRLAALKRAEVEREVAEAVANARAEALSWAKIGDALGTSGSSANERYGKQIEPLMRQLKLKPRGLKGHHSRTVKNAVAKYAAQQDASSKRRASK